MRTFKTKQEAQLPQTNSASAAHMEGVGHPAHPLRPCGILESESRNKRTSSVCRPLSAL